MSDDKIELTEYQLRTIIKNTVNDTLIKIGIEQDDPNEMQRDFIYLRELRLSMEKIKNKGVMTAIGIIVTGLCAIIWVGFKHFLIE